MFAIDQKRKVTSIRHNFDRITICRSLPKMIFTSKGLVPEQSPGIRLGTIVLAELVLRIILGGFYFKAVKRLIVLILLIVTQYQTKKIELASISSCIVTFYFIHCYRIGIWFWHVFIWQERNCQMIWAVVGNVICPILKREVMVIIGANDPVMNILLQGVCQNNVGLGSCAGSHCYCGCRIRRSVGDSTSLR